MAYIGQEPGQGQAERFIFTASGGETTVTADDDGLSIGYTVNQVSVFLNGVKLVLGTDFTATNGSTITFIGDSPDLVALDVVEVIALSSFSPANTVPKTGGTFTGAVTVPTPTATGHAVTKAYSDLKSPIASPTFTGVATAPSLVLTPTATASAPTGSQGALYYDSDKDALMQYGTSWNPVDLERSAGVKASGGIESVSGSYRYHVFKSTGSFTINLNALSCDILVIAGGAAGSLDHGGGGGAGGWASISAHMNLCLSDIFVD